MPTAYHYGFAHPRCEAFSEIKQSYDRSGTVKLVLPPLFLSLRGYAQLLPPLLSPLCSSKSSSLRCCGKPPLYPVPISESLMEVSYSQSIQWPSVPRPSINDYDRFTIARSIESQNRVSLKESTCDV